MGRNTARPGEGVGSGRPDLRRGGAEEFDPVFLGVGCVDEVLPRLPDTGHDWKSAPVQLCLPRFDVRYAEAEVIELCAGAGLLVEWASGRTVIELKALLRPGESEVDPPPAVGHRAPTKNPETNTKLEAERPGQIGDTEAGVNELHPRRGFGAPAHTRRLAAAHITDVRSGNSEPALS